MYQKKLYDETKLFGRGKEIDWGNDNGKGIVDGTKDVVSGASEGNLKPFINDNLSVISIYEKK